MPPHRHVHRFLSFAQRHWQRCLKGLAIGATLALAGCATNNQTAQGDSASRASRSTYLSQTQSDPLGVYLAKNQYLDYGDDSYYPSSRPAGSKSLASTALSFLGSKYKFGGDEPDTGFDCSGLVIYAAEKSLGLKLPRSAAQIARTGVSIKQSELKKGDLVFFNTRGHRYSHVGIYLGDQKFVHAPRAGSVVRIEDMTMTYWQKRYNGARRLAARSTIDGSLDATN